MSKAISSMWVGLTGNVSGLAKSFGIAITPIRGIGVAVDAVNNRVSAALGNLLKFGPAIAAGAAAAGIIALTKASIDNAGAARDQADALGITTDALTRMQFAVAGFGIENEQLAKGLTFMLAKLNEARNGSKGAAEDFTRLGLDIHALAAMSPEKALATIADRIRGLSDSNAKLGATTQLFGAKMSKLVPVMELGSAGLQALYERSDKLGYTLKDSVATQIDAAGDSMGELGKLLTGVGNVLAEKVSPFLIRGAEQLIEYATAGDGLGKTVGAAFEWVAKGIAASADYMNIALAGWHMLKAVAAGALGFILRPLAAVIEGVEWLGKKIGLVSDSSAWGDFANAVVKDVEMQAHDSFKAAGESWDKFMQGTSSKAITESFEEIRKQAEDIANAPPKPKAPRPLGDPDGLDELEPTDPTKGLSPLWKGAQQLGGFLSDQFDRATDWLGDKIAAVIPDQKTIDIEPRVPGLFRAGSAEAQSLRYGNLSVSPSQGQKTAGSEVAKKQLAEASRQTQELQSLNAKLAGGAVVLRASDLG